MPFALSVRWEVGWCDGAMAGPSSARRWRLGRKTEQEEESEVEKERESKQRGARPRIRPAGGTATGMGDGADASARELPEQVRRKPTG